jgi:hypothetical protein
LNWLRQWAPRIFSGELSQVSVMQAVRANAPEEAQASVGRAVELIFRSIATHEWRGQSLKPKKLLVSDFEIELSPIGIYRSKKYGKDFLLALQPRAEDVPTLDQFKIWHSCLFYNFLVSKSADVMIVDLSKNAVNGKRELRELTSRKLPLLGKGPSEFRLSNVLRQFDRALKAAPSQPKKRPGPKGQKDFGF